jgi:hypothetical protein
VPLDRVRLIAAKSSLGRHRKLRLARPQGSGSTSTLDDGLRLARPQGSDSTSTLDDGLRLARPRARTQPRPRKTVSASPDPRAQTQPRRWTTDSASPDPGLGHSLGLGRRSPPRPNLGLGHSLGLGRASTSPDLRLGPTTSQGGHHYPTPSSLRLRETRPASHLARPGKQIMMAARVLHDDIALSPLRKQGDINKDSTAPTVVLP